MTKEFSPKFEVMPYTTEDGKSGYSKIINWHGRHTVLANIRGTKIPFYISTGLGGKNSIEPGKWYPHFGVAEDGWINKHEDGMKIHYNSRHLKDVSDWLNTNLGDTRGPGGTSIFGDDDSNVPVVADKGPHIDEINTDLSPINWGPKGDVRENIIDALNRVHYHPKPMTQKDRLIDSAKHTLLKKHAEENPELELGVHLP